MSDELTIDPSHLGDNLGVIDIGGILEFGTGFQKIKLLEGTQHALSFTLESDGSYVVEDIQLKPHLKDLLIQSFLLGKEVSAYYHGIWGAPGPIPVSRIQVR